MLRILRSGSAVRGDRRASRRRWNRSPAWRVTGYDGGPPIVAGGVVDPMVGTTPLALIALDHRERTGEAQWSSPVDRGRHRRDASR
jgi:hypothetical protein